jgi:hypothetical protein
MEGDVRGFARCGAAVMLACAVGAAFPRAQAAAIYRERFIFASDRGHVHASSIVETPNGSLLVPGVGVTQPSGVQLRDGRLIAFFRDATPLQRRGVDGTVHREHNLDALTAAGCRGRPLG